MVVLDSDRITDKATLAELCTSPMGIEYVMVSGRIVFQKGEFTGELPGKMLWKKIREKDRLCSPQNLNV